MAGPFGISFVPGSQDPTNNNGETGRVGAPQSPVQQAIKVLSLRLPKFYGSQSLAPGLLLNSPGGMGQPAARGNVTAQAFAQMAGLPPSMAGDREDGSRGSDTFSGWAGNERAMNRPVPAPGAEVPSAEPPPPRSPGPPRAIPGGEAPGGQGLNDPFFATAPAPTGGGIAPPLSPEYRAFSLANPESPSAWTPEPYQDAIAPPPASPWEREGRNETLVRKYLDMLDQFGSA